MMIETISKLKNSKFIKAVKYFLSSKYFPFVTAAISLICYYLGWDIVFIYFTGITGVSILLLLDDITPFITLILFICILVSHQNSPSPIMGNSDYYFRPEILAQVFIVLAALLAAAAYRIILVCVHKKFSIHPVFFGLCAFAAVLLLNGIFSENYAPKNLLYGLITGSCFLGVFSFLKDSIVVNDDFFEKIALSFFALSVVLLIELVVKYLTTEELYVDGHFIRDKLTFGWGMWNTMGMMLTICIPSSVYLAYRYKYGFIFTLFSCLLFVAAWVSCSRQAMLASTIIFLVCIVILLIKGKNKIPNICIFVCMLIAISIVLVIFRDSIWNYVKNLLSQIFVNGELNGNNRIVLWKTGIDNFRAAPLFGAGFYADIYSSTGFGGFSGMSLIPGMCHNTIVQLLSCCGVAGFITYVIHNIQLVISFIRNMNIHRLFIAIIIIALAGISMADNHMFNIFPTIIYSSLVAILVSSEKKQESK